MASPSEWESGFASDGPPAEGDNGLVSAVARRKGLVFVVLVFGLGLGFLYSLKAERKYQSTAQILIVKQETDLPLSSAEGEVNYENQLSTHMLLAKSPMIVEAAVKKHDLGKLPGFTGVANPVDVIVANLTTERGGGRAAPDPNVFEIRYKGRDPEECKVVLDAVIDSYQESLGSTYQSAGAQTVQLIEQAKDSLSKQLTDKEAAYRQFRKEAPLVHQSEDGRNLHLLRMSEIEQDRSEVMLEKSQTLAQIESVKQIKRSGGNPEALTLIIGDSKILRPSEEGRDPLQYRLYDAMIDERIALDQYGSDHPEVKKIQTTIQMLREQLGGQGIKRSGPIPSFLDLYLEALQQELQVADNKLNNLNELFESEHEAAKKLEDFEIHDDTLKADIDRTQELFDNVMQHLDAISLVKDFGGIRAEVIWSPAAGRQVQPNLMVVMSIATVFSLMAGILLAYLVDLADTRYRDPEEIRRQFGLPILGHIPVIERRVSRRQRKESKMTPAVCTFFQPSGRDAEAYRNIRTSLLFNRDGKNLKVLQVTSPSSGDGKSTLCANLAVTLAQSGKDVLLIDADMRHASAHSIFGAANDLGLSSVLNGECDPFDAMQSSEVPHFTLLAAGPRPSNPAELLVSPDFSELLQVVREKFDLVIVDSPPVLPVSDPASIAPLVDATVVVLFLNKHVRRNAAEAVDILTDVGANIIGLVVNGVAKKSYNNKYYTYGGRYSDPYGHYYGGKKSSKTQRRDGARPQPSRRSSPV
ncbi:MAG: polysaccharide biosynthesis tyrosine autokinase [Planctomycetaceae bacterium]